MQAILMDHVKIISRIEQFVSTTEANEATSLRILPDEMKRQALMNSDQNEEDEVIDLETDQDEEDIYECETCYKTFGNVRGLETHLEMHYPNDGVANEVAVVEIENIASNKNEQDEEQVSYDENNLESNQNEIEEAAEEQVIDDENNFNSDQSEIDEQEVQDIDNVESPMNEVAIKIEQQEVDAIQRLMCKKTFANEQEFRDHLENSYESESVSEQSDDSFEIDESSLNGESNVDEKVEEHLQCEICNKSFSDIKQLLNHFDSNHDNHKCNPSKKLLSNDFSTALASANVQIAKALTEAADAKKASDSAIKALTEANAATEKILADLKVVLATTKAELAASNKLFDDLKASSAKALADLKASSDKALADAIAAHAKALADAKTLSDKALADAKTLSDATAASVKAANDLAAAKAKADYNKLAAKWNKANPKAKVALKK